MKKLIGLFLLLFIYNVSFSQELLSTVQVNSQQLGGSNQQAFKTLEKSLKDFINNTSWTGKKLQNFEKIKSNFAIVLTSKDGNKYGGNIVVQAVRPVYNSNYESPLINLQDTNFEFEYVENENLIFNERQFSGKNLIDVISFYVYLVLGYDADSFQSMGGTQWFAKAQQIAQNAQNRGYKGWAQIGSEGPRTRGVLISQLTGPNLSQLRSIYYTYHRAGLDNLYNQDQTQPKKIIYDALMQLKTYENSFQQNYALNLFLEVKNDEIFNIFNSNNNGGIVLNDLKQMMMVFAPKFNDKWNKWK
ncbi:DUF4835 family protein [Chryseobacterium sp. PTM-20240506]|uniref:type IX secretion system protein PorD n=1 Tax=unclassified Chryseobacterium TaxID=2593645 RepID=UPI001556C9CC|nr:MULTISPECIES: DUF4835 family protein [unclassified Chryseobacterium]MDC8105835.1 DUF4835 family protein [Chryseobacterium sp. B21-037]WBV55045.1 DUF4835 family protein [Chryseobacterium daecheongense]